MCVCVCVLFFVLFVTTCFLAPFNSCAVMYACVHLRLVVAVVDCFHTALFSALLIYGFFLFFCCVYTAADWMAPRGQ